MGTDRKVDIVERDSVVLQRPNLWVLLGCGQVIECKSGRK